MEGNINKQKENQDQSSSYLNSRSKFKNIEVHNVKSNLLEESKVGQNEGNNSKKESNHRLVINVGRTEPVFTHNDLPHKENISQQKSDHKQTEKDRRSNVDFSKSVVNIVLSHNTTPFLSSKAAISATAAREELIVKTNKSSCLNFLDCKGTISTAPNQPAAKLTNNSENTEDQTTLVILNNLPKDRAHVNAKENLK